MLLAVRKMSKHNNTEPSAMIFSSEAGQDMADITKRTTIVLPRAIYEALEHWAESEGRATANLAAFMVEQSVRARFPEQFPPRIRFDRTGEDLKVVAK